jgi:hypothetical protein
MRFSSELEVPRFGHRFFENASLFEHITPSAEIAIRYSNHARRHSVASPQAESPETINWLHRAVGLAMARPTDGRRAALQPGNNPVLAAVLLALFADPLD